MSNRPNVQKNRISIRERLLYLANKSGLIKLGHPFLSKSLTVLNYHRINNPNLPNFDSFHPNVSALPEMFRQQMDYLSRWFNVISLSDLIQGLRGEKKLPEFAALITFDDGYLDNYATAYPILKEYNFPAVIFLTSGHIDTDAPFFWDLAAYCFFHTSKDHVMFPNKEERSWEDGNQKNLVTTAWVESMKALTNTEKQKWVGELPDQLHVSIPKNYFRNLMMNWGQIREMSNNRIEFGGHTITHPILTSISLDQAHTEISGSKFRIEEETGQPVYSFAYPNGMKNDLNPAIEALVNQAGYQTAFTLIPGPTSFREVRSNPFAIKRVFVIHSDSLPRFAALLNPFLKRYIR